MSSVTQLHEPSTANVPFAVRDHGRIPRQRYFDRGFYELEKQKLWFRTWQMACRLEEIPEPNDFVEYDICDQSILVVRQRDGAARAFFNACRHRATQLAQGSGNFGDGTIVCPYHGWSWRTNGACAYVHGKNDFPEESLQPADLRLQECKAEIWGGCVWINLDPHAGPLMDALQPVAGLMDELDVANLRVEWWKEVILEANWKVAQEAFMESLHVMQTHPQLTMGAGRTFDYVAVSAFERYQGGHSGFWNSDTVSDFATLDIFIEINRLLAEGMDGLVLPRDIQILRDLKDKQKPGEVLSRADVANGFRAYYTSQGIPMREGVEASPWWWTTNIFMFPNFFLLPMYANGMSYRARPYKDDPERCRFEMWSLTTQPKDTPVKRATLTGRFDKADARNWSLVPLQDYSNIERQQRGLHSIRHDSQRLSRTAEGGIAHMHRELDRRLARP